MYEYTLCSTRTCIFLADYVITAHVHYNVLIEQLEPVYMYMNVSQIEFFHINALEAHANKVLPTFAVYVKRCTSTILVWV
jgi:hypothetical protein